MADQAKQAVESVIEGVKKVALGGGDKPDKKAAKKEKKPKGGDDAAAAGPLEMTPPSRLLEAPIGSFRQDQAATR
ncbi:Threonine--tRNA ligase [Apiospora arundinis]